MKQKTLNLMEEAISSAGRWTWLELSDDSVQFEFGDVQLYKHGLEKYKNHSSEIAVRLADNAFFILFYNNDNDIDFLIKSDDFSKKISNEGLRFQDEDLFSKIANHYDYNKTIIGKNFNDYYEVDIDFLLVISLEKIAMVCGANQLNFFNNFESLNDGDIKKLSNQWWIYYLDYWKSKKTDNEYEYDPACEIIPFMND